MANPKVPGRMIRRSIAISKGVSKLGPEATAVFCMILPHLDGYGKMLGEPAVVKEVALPLAKWATVEVVAKALREIHRHTNIRWWKHSDGRKYLHSVHFEKHQDLRADRRGIDHLPSFKALRRKKAPDLVSDSVRPEVEVEGKDNNKEEVEFEDSGAESRTGLLRPSAPAPPSKPRNFFPGVPGKDDHTGAIVPIDQGRDNGIEEATSPEKGKTDIHAAAIRTAMVHLESGEWSRKVAVEKLISLYGFDRETAESALAGKETS